MFQIPLCAIFSSYYSCNKVLAIAIACATTCGGKEDDATTLVWCMGKDQLMMGDDELIGLGPAISFGNNGSYLGKSLL